MTPKLIPTVSLTNSARDLREAQAAGWHKVKAWEYWENAPLNEWLGTNIKGGWTRFGYLYYFEQENDALLFQLRWS